MQDNQIPGMPSVMSPGMGTGSHADFSFGSADASNPVTPSQPSVSVVQPLVPENPSDAVHLVSQQPLANGAVMQQRIDPPSQIPSYSQVPYQQPAQPAIPATPAAPAGYSAQPQVSAYGQQTATYSPTYPATVPVPQPAPQMPQPQPQPYGMQPQYPQPPTANPQPRTMPAPPQNAAQTPPGTTPPQPPEGGRPPAPQG